MDNCLFETYENYGIPYGHHIYETAADMAMSTMCAYPPSQHALPHYKYLFGCYDNLPCIDIPD